jgi:anti-sigma regulatory factor (Ser/Thr protein kinase)
VALSIHSEGTVADDATVVSIDGLLTVMSARDVNNALAKAFAGGPEVVIADLSGLRATDRSILSIFRTAQRLAPDPATTLMLCTPAPVVEHAIAGGILGDIPVYPSRAAALVAAAKQAEHYRRTTIGLSPVDSAPADARDWIAEACATWAVDQLADSAKLVVSELVTNAVTHARTDLRAQAALRRDFLHLAVHDGIGMSSGELPAELPSANSVHGRGLYFVKAVATSWGMSPARGGKVTWATLRAVSADA